MSPGRDIIGKVCRPETVLVAEDESIIAFALEDELTEAGYALAGPFATTSATMGWLSTAMPDLAILNTTLRDGSSRAVALALITRRVPFIVYSANCQAMNTLPEFDQGVWIEKPSRSGALTQALAALQSARIPPTS